MKKKIGIITFHNSYNCGSMLESYAMLKVIEKREKNVEIINFSNVGQRKLYSVFIPNNSLKNIVKNILVFPAKKRIAFNNKKYEEFKNKYFKLSNNEYDNMNKLPNDVYSTVIAGSDQVWNITIEDGDDAYFLPWALNANKIAYAPSFGSKNILKYAKNPEKYRNYINEFKYLSIRENNGKKWIKELCNRDVDVLCDPTLLIDSKEYDKLIDHNSKYENDDYIFFYCPSFDTKICKFVKKISKKYNKKVIVWSTKSYYFKFVKRYGFELVDYETPSLYLNLIKNASLVITTSFHGTIFSTIYRKKFITVKNGGMYGDDDRVITLLTELGMMNRLIPFDFDNNYNYFEEVDYSTYDEKIKNLRLKANNYIDKALEVEKNEKDK